MPVYVQGLTELSRAFAKTDRAARLGFRKVLREAAEPVRADAQTLALEKIRRMPRSPKWAGMRIGVTRNLVYVAPRQKGTHGRGPRRRPNLADLLMTRAMDPALHAHETQIEQRVEHALDRLCDEFNAGGTA